MKCAFATLEWHGIENGWSPLGQLFTDDNSNLGWLVQSARLGLPAVEYSSVGRLCGCGTVSNSDQSDSAASAAGLHWTFARR